MDPQGHRSTDESDSAGRTIRQILEAPDGTQRVTTYGYDEHGRQYLTVSSRGEVRWNEFDDAGRTTVSYVQTGGALSVTRQGYDVMGRTIWSQTDIQSAADTPRFTTYEYNLGVSADDRAYGQLLTVWFEDTEAAPSSNVLAAKTGGDVAVLIVAYDREPVEAQLAQQRLTEWRGSKEFASLAISFMPLAELTAAGIVPIGDANLFILRNRRVFAKRTAVDDAEATWAGTSDAVRRAEE